MNRMIPDDPDRRRALGVLAGAGAAALGLGCGGGGHGASSASDGSACSATPEGEIGPFFADDRDPRLHRGNIVANVDGTAPQPGSLLTLTLTIVDAKRGCVPYAGAQVDIWHCNASGVYSAETSEGTASDTWLRGYQLTSAAGQVTFTTVVPGWYPGRATHIHLRVRSSYGSAATTTDGSNTTQLFIEQPAVDALATTVAPYSAQGKNPTTNVADRVYATETRGANVLALAGDAASGYTASLVIGLPITS